MNFYTKGISKLISSWQKCIECNGSYLINKDVFEPSYNDLKFTVQNCNYFGTNLIHVSKLVSQVITLSPSLAVFSTSASLFLPCKKVHQYHFSRFHIYALKYIYFSLSALLHSVWWALGPSFYCLSNVRLFPTVYVFSPQQCIFKAFCLIQFESFNSLWWFHHLPVRLLCPLTDPVIENRCEISA